MDFYCKYEQSVEFHKKWCNKKEKKSNSKSSPWIGGLARQGGFVVCSCYKCSEGVRIHEQNDVEEKQNSKFRTMGLTIQFCVIRL